MTTADLSASTMLGFAKNMEAELTVSTGFSNVSAPAITLNTVESLSADGRTRAVELPLVETGGLQA